jgi:hypothetical protein
MKIISTFLCSRYILFLVLDYLYRAKSQSAFCAEDNFCALSDGSIQTPANNTEIRTSCTPSNQNQSALVCSTIALHVLVAAGQTVVFAPSSNLLNTGTCTTPLSFGSTVCGIGPTRNITDSTGKRFQAFSYASKPAPLITPSSFGKSSTPYLCFRLTGSTNQRCVHFFINVAPSAPLETTTQKFDFSVFVGYKLDLKFSSSHIIDGDQVDIHLNTDRNSPELPGAVWSGPTSSSGPNSWERGLVYMPRREEDGNVYTVYYQASAVGYPQNPIGEDDCLRTQILCRFSCSG